MIARVESHCSKIAFASASVFGSGFACSPSSGNPVLMWFPYSRRHYELNDNGGGGPGRWVSDKPGNRFDQLKQLLTDKINKEIKSLETA
jgi:hypothetical protein